MWLVFMYEKKSYKFTTIDRIEINNGIVTKKINNVMNRIEGRKKTWYDFTLKITPKNLDCITNIKVNLNNNNNNKSISNIGTKYKAQNHAKR